MLLGRMFVMSKLGLAVDEKGRVNQKAVDSPRQESPRQETPVQDTPHRGTRRKHRLLLAAGACLLAGNGIAHANLVTLTGNDAINTSSFADAGNPTGFTSNWSDSSFPTSGNTYSVTGSLTIRTPSIGGNFAFAGDSLTLGAGSGNGGSVSVKSTGTFTGTYILNNGAFATNTDNITGTIAGTITLNGSGSFSGTSGAGRNLTITAPISGTGALTLQNASTNGVTALKPSNGNTYSGNTTIATSTGTVAAQADGAFGTGNVTVATGGVLRLEQGTFNNYINDNATFSLTGTATANLNYSGSDSVKALILGGVSQPAGIYGSSTSGAPNVSSFFTGSGTIQVLPEPSAALALLGVAGLLQARRRRRVRPGV